MLADIHSELIFSCRAHHFLQVKTTTQMLMNTGKATDLTGFLSTCFKLRATLETKKKIESVLDKIESFSSDRIDIQPSPRNPGLPVGRELESVRSPGTSLEL